MAMRIGDDADGPAEVHEINVTPFIDVVLVLLIIFMVAAPLSTVDIAIELPSAHAVPQPRLDKPVFVTIKADQTIAVGDDVVGKGGLAAALSSATRSDTSQRIYLRADKAASYGSVMDLMNDLRAAGYLKVALVALEAVSKP